MSITMRQMLEAGCHFGHQTRFWNPQMSAYIYGERNHIHIINLEKTIVMFRKTLAFVQGLAKNHGSVLFVGTKRAASEIIAEEAARCQMPYVDHRWLGGMLTNFKTVKKSIKRLQEMEKEAQEGFYDTVAKKEALMHQRKIDKLSRSLKGISGMYSLPDAVFVIDVDYQRIAVAEANKLGIPVIGIVDTNSSPLGIDYIIPGNDDSQRAIRLYARGIADAVLLGRSQSVQELKKIASDTEIEDSVPESAESDVVEE